MPWLDTEISAIIINKKPKAVLAIETAIKKVNNSTDQVSINLLGFTSTPSGAIEFRPRRPRLVFWDIEFSHENLEKVLNNLQETEPELAIIITSKKKDELRISQVRELGKRMGIGSIRWVVKPYNIEKLVNTLCKTINTSLTKQVQFKKETNNELLQVIQKQKEYLFFVKNQPRLLKNTYLNIDEVAKKELIVQIQLNEIITIAPHPKSKNYLSIAFYNADGKIEHSNMLRNTISSVEKLLSQDYGFVRVNRSCIVNALKIIHYSPDIELITIPELTNCGVSTHRVTRAKQLKSLGKSLELLWYKKTDKK